MCVFFFFGEGGGRKESLRKHIHKTSNSEKHGRRKENKQKENKKMEKSLKKAL